MAHAAVVVLVPAVLLAILVFAVARPRGLPEATVAVPGALLVCLTGALSWQQAWEETRTVLPTVVFLACILMLSYLCHLEGVFTAAGSLMARHSRGSPRRLLGVVFVVAALITTVLSLDATVVLLTPVVLATAARVGVPPKPAAYATAHLSNSASLLLPVSNLTNLLAVAATGMSFLGFAQLMALPWLIALGVEYALFRCFFARDLAAEPVAPTSEPAVPVPGFALAVVGLTLVGFVAGSLLGVEPLWAALLGVVVLVAKRVAGDSRHLAARALGLGRAANVLFLLFVIGLDIVVRAVMDLGVGPALRTLLPSDPGLPHLIVLALLAAALANLVNNIPAVLVLLPLVAPLGPVAVAAVLIGVDVGPNLTYVGSLATLLWRRIVVARGYRVRLTEFTALGLLTVPAILVLATAGLWLGAELAGITP